MTNALWDSKKSELKTSLLPILKEFITPEDLKQGLTPYDSVLILESLAGDLTEDGADAWMGVLSESDHQAMLNKAAIDIEEMHGEIALFVWDKLSRGYPSITTDDVRGILWGSSCGEGVTTSG